ADPGSAPTQEMQSQPAQPPAVQVAPAPAEPDPMATAKIRSPVSQQTRQSLAARVADAAVAQLLLFDTLPDDERPRPGGRVLLVGLVWGNKTLIELEQVSRGQDLQVGKLFDLPSASLAKNFQIVRHVGQDLVLTVPADLQAELHTAGGTKQL